jgi:hypothetical protein
VGVRVTALAIEATKDHLRTMFGAVLHKMLLALGLRKVPPAVREPSSSADDDFVARYGLSYGEAGDPISKEARFEAERQKSFRGQRRR